MGLTLKFVKTIALIDTNAGRGHHLTYLRLFSKILLELGHRVVAFYPTPSEVTEWIKINSPKNFKNFFAFKMQKSNRRQFPIFGIEPEPTAVLGRWSHAAKHVKFASSSIGIPIDLVFFNWIDNYLSHYLPHHIIDLIFPYNWSGLYFRPGHLRFGRHYLPLLNSPLVHYTIAKSRRCKMLAVLNDETVEIIQNKIQNQVVAFPDITNESLPENQSKIIEEIRIKAGNRKIIGLIGSLSKRKGLLTLFKVAKKSINENWFFVFVGSLVEEYYNQDYNQDFSDEIFQFKKTVETQPNNCFFHFNHIPSESEYNSFVQLCDIIFAAYENFPYSSNMLTKAAVFRKPVIVTEGFCMAKRVNEFQLGICIPEGDISKCIQAIYLLNNDDYKAKNLNFDFEGYQRMHSIEAATEVFRMLVDKIDAKNKY